MNKIIINNNIDTATTIKYLLMYLCLFNSSKVFGGVYSDYFLLASLLITFWAFVHLRIKINVKISWLFSCVVFWTTLLFIKYGYLHTSSIVGLVIKLLYAYLLLLIIKNDFLKCYVNSLYYLALLSIPLFFIGLIFPDVYKSLYSALHSINLLDSDRVDGFSLWVYNIHLTGLTRNCGFMWEPGAYACVLNFGIFFNFILNKIEINKKTIVFIVALVTTFSTTGYIAIIPTLLFASYNSRVKQKIFYVTIFLTVCVIFLNTPFIKGKITRQYRYNFIEGKLQEHVGVPDRFLSLRYDLQQFSKNIFVGTGPGSQTRFENFSIYAGSTVGISDFIVKFGLYGTFFLFLNLFISGKQLIITENKLKGWWFFALLFLVNSSSEVFIDPPIALCIQLYHLKDPLLRKYRENIFQK